MRSVTQATQNRSLVVFVWFSCGVDFLKSLVVGRLIVECAPEQKNCTHHSLRGCGTWGREVPVARGMALAVLRRPDTDTDPEREHTRGRTCGTAKRSAGGWCR
jgi:hypothetical protein